MKKVNRKPLAADRTVDMFTGLTNVEQAEAAAQETKEATFAKERDRSGTVEDSVMESDSPYKTRDFGSPMASETQFRVVLSGDHFYLEQLRYSPSGVGAYHYAGLMFRRSELDALCGVLNGARDGNQ